MIKIKANEIYAGMTISHLTEDGNILVPQILKIILNNVRQRNYFITQGNYIRYMFRLLFSHLQAYFVN